MHCNDGTIPFPTCYTGTVDATLPTDAWSYDKWTDWQVPKWVISTEDEDLHGETYTLTVNSNYDGYVTNTQTILLTIYGECEDQSHISVTVPTLTEKISYALGAPAATVTIPAFLVVPATCVQTLVVTIPTTCSDVVTSVTGTDKLKMEGATDSTVEPGDYIVTVQPKTAAGFLVTDAILEITITITAPVVVTNNAV